MAGTRTKARKKIVRPNRQIITPNQNRSNEVLQMAGMSGSLGMRLMANNMNPACLRTQAVLLKDEWVDLDTRIIQIAQERLSLTQDLIEAGLTYELGGIGTTISQWQVESDMTDATVSMEPDSEDNRDLLEYQLAQVPVPIIHKDFKLGIRQLEATRRMGSNIDLTNADAAARRVAVGMEDLVIKGYPSTFVGQNIWGVTNHPDRITGVATGNWLSDIDAVYTTVLSMLAAADARHRYGPFNLYISPGLGQVIYYVYPDGSGQTVLQRLQNIDAINEIKVNDRLADGDLVLVQMTADTIDLAVAQPLIPVEWDEKGGLVVNFKIMTALVPRIKPDGYGELGIVHYSGARG